MRFPRATARAGAALACFTLVLTTASTLLPVAAVAEELGGVVAGPAVEAPAAEIPALGGPLPAVLDAPPVREVVEPSLPNRAPVANDDRVVVVQGGSATLDLFANDSDLDGDALSLVGGTSAGHGTISFTDGVATYTADSDFVGDDAFVYVVGDGRGATSSATVHVTVTPAQLVVAPPAREPSDPDPAPAAAEPVRVSAPAPARPVAARSAVTQPQQVLAVRSSPRRATAITARPMGPSTTPYVAPAALPATLPFTGGATDALLPFGVGLLLGGGLVAALGRRRDPGAAVSA